MLSENAFKRTTIFNVEPISEFSDHCLINLRLQANELPKNSLNGTIHPLILGFKWDKYSAESFKETLDHGAVKKDIEQLLQNKYEINEMGTNSLADDLTKVITKIASLSLKRKHSKYHIKKKRKFKNREIENIYADLKRQIRSLGKILRKFPSDPFIRGKFFSTKKDVNRIIKKTQKQIRGKLCYNESKNLKIKIQMNFGS